MARRFVALHFERGTYDGPVFEDLDRDDSLDFPGHRAVIRGALSALQGLPRTDGPVAHVMSADAATGDQAPEDLAAERLRERYAITALDEAATQQLLTGTDQQPSDRRIILLIPNGEARRTGAATAAAAAATRGLEVSPDPDRVTQTPGGDIVVKLRARLVQDAPALSPPPIQQARIPRRQPRPQRPSQAATRPPRRERRRRLPPTSRGRPSRTPPTSSRRRPRRSGGGAWEDLGCRSWPGS